MIVISLVVAFMALVIQYEFRPYKLDAMNTVKVMEAWQNILFIVALLIQDAHMFERDGMFEWRVGTRGRGRDDGRRHGLVRLETRGVPTGQS